MLNLSFAISQVKDAVLRRPVEIHEIFLGDQIQADSQTLFFANYYRQINFFNFTSGLAQSYQPLKVSRSAIKKSSKAEVDRMDYKIDNVNKAMRDYANATDFRNKRIVTRLVFRDYLDSADNAKVVFDGIIQSIQFERSSMKATCVPIISSLDFETGWPYQINCSAKFGDSFCTVSKSAPENSKSGTATGGTTATLIDTVVLTQSDDYWNVGEILMTSGDNDKQRRKIIDFDQATATLVFDFEMPISIQAGDTYTVTRGCDKRLATCQNIYNNDPNYRGFHTIPLNETNL